MIIGNEFCLQIAHNWSKIHLVAKPFVYAPGHPTIIFKMRIVIFPKLTTGKQKWPRVWHYNGS